MRNVILVLGLLAFGGAARAADAPSVNARSIADNCRFVYRIETDFELSGVAAPSRSGSCPSAPNGSPPAMGPAALTMPAVEIRPRFTPRS